MLRHRCLALAVITGCLSSPPVTATLADSLAVQVPPALHAVYDARQFSPLWLEQGQPSARAGQALAMLATAGDDGLDARDYNLTVLQQQHQALAQHPGDDAAQAQFDLALSTALADYARDLAVGRVAPRSLGLDLDLAPQLNRLPEQVQHLLTASDLAAAATSLRPAFPAYATLRQQLAHYRTLAAAHPQPPAFPPLPGRKLEPGQAWEGTPALANWLAVLGDLPADALLPAQYDGPLVEALQRFQTRHGLDPDGVIGTQTLRALQVPLGHRVQQIALSLERLRWLDDPLLSTRRFIAINIPQFTLWAFAPGPAGPQPVTQMAVVVGEARKTQTPLMAKSLSSLVFSPYWNVPRSIATKELLPKLHKDPHYLVHEDMEWVDQRGMAQGHHFDRDAESRLLLGEWRIRQRAGDQNALGKLKFVFPNDDAIYMHDTPAKRLFAKARRDFSHGCIRVSDPMGLALFALESHGEWDEDRVNAKIASGTDQHLALKERMPVLLLYFTANVDAEGRALFFDDIYDKDAKLAAALARKLR